MVTIFSPPCASSRPAQYIHSFYFIFGSDFVGNLLSLSIVKRTLGESIN